jgi:ABC-type uncharacterized transport system permease subunit
MIDEVTLPRSYRPFGARMAAALAAIVLVGVMAFLWLMLPAHTRATFGLSERVTLILFFAAVLVVLNGLFRTVAIADDSGLTVRNGYRVRRFDWPEIIRISLSANRPWALLDLADGTAVSVMALQTSDGARAVQATRELATVIASHSEPGTLS